MHSPTIISLFITIMLSTLGEYGSWVILVISFNIFFPQNFPLGGRKGGKYWTLHSTYLSISKFFLNLKLQETKISDQIIIRRKTVINNTPKSEKWEYLKKNLIRSIISFPAPTPLDCESSGLSALARWCQLSVSGKWGDLPSIQSWLEAA